VNDWDWLRKDIKNRKHRLGCLALPLGLVILALAALS
jgi:hypothetical protein